MRDDGAVVFLNGAEILRSNMPSGAIAPETKALQDIDGGSERTWHVHHIEAELLAGDNVMAVEIHQSAAYSDDLAFDMRVVGEFAN